MLTTNQPMFQEAVERVSELVEALEGKYRAVEDDGQVIVLTVLEALTGVAAVYVASRLFPPTEANRVTQRLRTDLATYLKEFLFPAYRGSDVSKRPWHAGRKGTA
jgi:hypothetical protein